MAEKEKDLAPLDDGLSSIVTFDLDGEVPNLDAFEESPLDVTEEYWTPQNAGEKKRVFFAGLRERDRLLDDGTSQTALAAYFMEQVEGELVTICNASKRLVGVFERGRYAEGTPFLITYLGKKKNQTNQYMSDHWSVKPLIAKK